MDKIDSPDAFADHIAGHPLAAVYFSGPDCGLCHALKPKLASLFDTEFPAMALAEVDCSRLAELAASQSVFAFPTLLVYIEGHESFRYVRNFGPAQVQNDLQRPYAIFSTA